jgi:hypothetical protein
MTRIVRAATWCGILGARSARFVYARANYAGGACVAVPEIDCVGEKIASAKCACN